MERAIEKMPMSDAGNPGQPANATKARLMTTAERLFAERGIDAVSIRDITSAAEANSAAIHYHYGSKHGLVLAVLEHRVQKLRDRREELLAEIEQLDSPTSRDIARSLVLPSAELATDKQGGQHYVVFVTALSNHTEYASSVSDLFEPLTRRFLAVLATACPDVPDEVRSVRYAVATEVVNRVFSNLGALHSWLTVHAPSAADTDMEAALIDFLAAALDGEPKAADRVD